MHRNTSCIFHVLVEGKTEREDYTQKKPAGEPEQTTERTSRGADQLRTATEPTREPGRCRGVSQDSHRVTRADQRAGTIPERVTDQPITDQTAQREPAGEPEQITGEPIIQGQPQSHQSRPDNRDDTGEGHRTADHRSGQTEGASRGARTDHRQQIHLKSRSEQKSHSDPKRNRVAFLLPEQMHKYQGGTTEE